MQLDQFARVGDDGAVDEAGGIYASTAFEVAPSGRAEEDDVFELESIAFEEMEFETIAICVR